jgi:hypothetical protein
MSRDETVCNYTNSETFDVALFLSNNKPQYGIAWGLAQMALEKGTDSEYPNALPEALIWLEDELKELVEQHYLRIDDREEENAHKVDIAYDCDTLAHSLLTAALGRVDWRQIANEWLTTAKEG